MKKIIFSLIITFFISAYGVAEQTTSTFSVNGWTPGNTTPLSLNYGSSLTTILNFTPCWSGGQVDHDNPDDVWLDYYYTLYLTPVGSSFSTTTSIPIGNHHIHNYWHYEGIGTEPPVDLYIDNIAQSAPTNCLNSLTTNIGSPYSIVDHFCGYVPSGSYQVDVLMTEYTYSVQQATIGYAVWQGYTNNTTTLTSINDQGQYGPLSPASNFLLSKIALVNFSSSSSTPITLSVPSPIRVCSNNKASATVTANVATGCALTYLWSDASHQTTATATNLSPGTYTVTVTAPSGTTATASTTINTGAVTATASSSPATGCVGTALTLTANASNGNSPYTYSWSAGTPSGNTDIVTPSSAGTPSYTVTVTDANGCVTTASKSVTVYSNPVASVNHNPAFVGLCTGLDITASGGTSYSWSNGSTTATSHLCYNVPITCTWYSSVSVNVMANGCTTTITIPVSYAQHCTNPKSGDVAMDKDISFNFYPNPAQGTLNIALEGDAVSEATLFLTDMIGRKVLERTYDIVPSFVAPIDVAGIAKGEYIATIKMDGQIYFRKISIQ